MSYLRILHDFYFLSGRDLGFTDMFASLVHRAEICANGRHDIPEDLGPYLTYASIFQLFGKDSLVLT